MLRVDPYCLFVAKFATLLHWMNFREEFEHFLLGLRESVLAIVKNILTRKTSFKDFSKKVFILNI